MTSRDILHAPAFISPNYARHMFTGPQRSLRGQVCMTAGQASPSESSSTPIRPPKPAPPTSSHKVENRPELVGGLPLWLTVGAIGTARRFLESFNFGPAAELRRRAIEHLDTVVGSTTDKAKNVELPAARVLRRVADMMEEEVASLRVALAAMRTELTMSQTKLNVAVKELEFLKMKNAKKSDSEEELSKTATHLRYLLCKEQTRATAAEKELMALKKRLLVAEKKSSLLEGDMVKVSIVYSSAFVLLLAFLAESPYASSLLHYLVTGGQ